MRISWKRGGALYYSVGEEWHVLIITSKGSSRELAKYFCLAYNSRSKDQIHPDKTWVKFRELVYKNTNAALDLESTKTNKAQEDKP